MNIGGVFNVPVLAVAARPSAPALAPRAAGGIPAAERAPAGGGGAGGGGGGGGDAGDAGDASRVVGQQGAFVTAASLGSFAGATVAVTTIWKVSGIVVAGWDREPIVGLFAALAVGFALFLMSEFGQNRGPATAMDRFGAAFVGLVNSLIVFNAALGAGAATGMTGPA